MKFRIIFFGLVFILAACEPADKLQKEKSSTEIKTAATGMQAVNPWIRVAGVGMNSAAFFEVKNNSDVPDTLLSASSDIAELVQVHETYMNDQDMMGMREVKSIVVPAHGSVEFKPRALHVMFMKLKQDLKTGDTVNFSLNFKHSGELKLSAEVKEMDMGRKIRH